MCSDVVIRATNLSKTYRIYDRPFDRVRQMFSLGGKRHYREFEALKDVSFEIRKGETVGIIGRNGSGKSTLLQLICGILKPTSGSVTVNGRVSALLELGAGFHPEFTGAENVYLQGAMAGLTPEEIRSKLDDILSFADIGEYINQPIKTYSSGMAVRLAFAVQIFLEPDLMIIDEALSVGDFFFQQKCLRHIRNLRDRGLTLLFVSHDSNIVRDMCDKAIYLVQARISYFGETRLALARYFGGIEEGTTITSIKSPPKCEKWVSAKFDNLIRDSSWKRLQNNGVYKPSQLIAVGFYDDNRPTTSFVLGQTMCVRVLYMPDDSVPTHVSLVVKNRFDQVVTSIGSSRLGLDPPKYKINQPLIFEIRIKLVLEAGSYSVTVSLGHLLSANRGKCIDSSDAIGPIVITWDYENQVAPFLGMFGPPVKGVFLEC